MHWRNLKIPTRIFIGYGLNLGLIVALGLIFITRTATLNTNIRDLSVGVAGETTTSAELIAQVAATQQAIDRYLQYSTPESLRTASTALQQLSAVVAGADRTLLTPDQRKRQADLANQVLVYEGTFQSLSRMIEIQAANQQQVNQELLNASVILNQALTEQSRSTAYNSLSIQRFGSIYPKLQMATQLNTRLATEQQAQLAEQALAEVTAAGTITRTARDTVDVETQQLLDTLLTALSRVKTGLSQYRTDLSQVQYLRNALLTEQGGRLKAQADAISAAALERLTNTTADLEQQSRQAQQLTGAAVALTVLIVTIFGVVVPQTITKPLKQLLGATRRINAGDYGVVVPTTDGSELGQLGAAFNQMTTALARERAEVQRQQATLAEQNQELAHTLTELQTTTQAREQLTMAVRALSVPVIPISAQVILIPLVGEIDAPRAATLLERLLHGITVHCARSAIIDVTGVSGSTGQLVDWLVNASQAAKLLGAESTLVGIGPDLAQALAASGANLAALVTKADLRSAVEDATHRFSTYSSNRSAGAAHTLSRRTSADPRGGRAEA